MDTFDSTTDLRILNNTMRHQYRVLTEGEKVAVNHVRDTAVAFHDYLGGLGSSRELSIAKMKIEEAVMWAVKHITA